MTLGKGLSVHDHGRLNHPTSNSKIQVPIMNKLLSDKASCSCTQSESKFCVTFVCRQHKTIDNRLNIDLLIS